MGKVRIKKGDTVEVIAGKQRKHRGRVLRIDRDRDRVVVEGVNMIKRHTRPNPSKNVQGGIVEREAPIHVSNLMVVCPKTDLPTRIRKKQLDTGKWVRSSARSGEMIDS